MAGTWSVGDRYVYAQDAIDKKIPICRERIGKQVSRLFGEVLGDELAIVKRIMTDITRHATPSLPERKRRLELIAATIEYVCPATVRPFCNAIISKPPQSAIEVACRCRGLVANTTTLDLGMIAALDEMIARALTPQDMAFIRGLEIVVKFWIADVMAQAAISTESAVVVAQALEHIPIEKIDEGLFVLEEHLSAITASAVRNIII